MQSSHTITLDWVEIWPAYLEAGLSKREFYRQCLPNLISSRKRPPLGVFYPASRQKITQSPETKQTLLLKALFNRGFFLAPRWVHMI